MPKEKKEYSLWQKSYHNQREKILLGGAYVAVNVGVKSIKDYETETQDSQVLF